MCANGMHEGSDCPGFGPGCDDDDSVRCPGCDEPLRACACEEETVETAALDVAAVSEAETVRRQFRDELVKTMGRAIVAGNSAVFAGHRFAAEAGAYEGGIQGILIRLCGMSADEAIRAAKGGAR